MRSIGIIKCKNYISLDMCGPTGMEFHMVSQLWNGAMSCEFARSVCHFICQQILLQNPLVQASATPENKKWAETEAVKETLRNLVPKGQMLIHAQHWDQFVIHQTMNKELDEYHDTNGDHTKVAKQMMSLGMSVRAGDVVPYIQCIDMTRRVDTGASKANPGVYPYHPVLVEQANGALQPDLHYYIKEKIFKELRKAVALCDITPSAAKTRAEFEKLLDNPSQSRHLRWFDRIAPIVLQKAWQAQAHLRDPRFDINGSVVHSQ